LLAAATKTEADSYQVLICVAREAGRLLRPDGHPTAEPIGASPDVLDPLLAAPTSAVDALRDVATAARLLGSAAALDAPMTRALALAVAGADDAPTSARAVLRAMLEILAH